MRRHLHWLTWQPTPYHNYFFTNLAQAMPGDLKVHYLKEVVESHPWKTAGAAGHPSRYCRPRAGLDWRLLWLALSERRSFFVVAGWNHRTWIAVLIVLRLLRRDYAVWTDTPSVANRRTPLVAYARATFLRWILRGAAAVMGTGTHALALLEQMGAAPGRLVNLPFFPDLSVLRRVRGAGRQSNQPVVIISVGYLVNARKGHDLALRALAEVMRVPPPFPVHYSIAGAGADEQHLRGLVTELGLEPNVSFLGWLEPDAITALYRDSDVLLHPSPLEDPYPNAVLDAMAAGLVTFASDACGPAHDRIVHGVNGFVHRAGDVAALTSQLTSLLDDPKRIAEIGRRARATAEEWPVQRGVEAIRLAVAFQAAP